MTSLTYYLKEVFIMNIHVNRPFEKIAAAVVIGAGMASGIINANVAIKLGNKIYEKTGNKTLSGIAAGLVVGGLGLIDSVIRFNVVDEMLPAINRMDDIWEAKCKNDAIRKQKAEQTMCHEVSNDAVDYSIDVKEIMKHVNGETLVDFCGMLHDRCKKLYYIPDAIRIATEERHGLTDPEIIKHNIELTRVSLIQAWLTKSKTRKVMTNFILYGTSPKKASYEEINALMWVAFDYPILSPETHSVLNELCLGEE